MRLPRRAFALLVLLTLVSAASLQAAPQQDPAQPTVDITIDGSAAGTAVNPRLLGTHLPSRLGSWRTENATSVSYTHLRAHATVLDLVCRLLFEKKKKKPTHCNLRWASCTNKTPYLSDYLPCASCVHAYTH